MPSRKMIDARLVELLDQRERASALVERCLRKCMRALSALEKARRAAKSVERRIVRREQELETARLERAAAKEEVPSE